MVYILDEIHHNSGKRRVPCLGRLSSAARATDNPDRQSKQKGRHDIL